ncbi:hypothetical protein IWQ60_007615 [Tieghemiomyces parasiticus]|uniref:Uncharacterized protein n=1 Tax=Tieghemiomyces parasiticus TaxID=78921 RepID=A0A9W8A255_9FUNG|nr:hypothetical protein IWQ60_007615 [Tieghemiomyces parasiticus]
MIQRVTQGEDLEQPVWQELVAAVRLGSLAQLEHQRVQLGERFSAYVTHRDGRGDTLAHFAARHRRQDSLRWLIEVARVDPTLTNRHGRTPLHEAVDDYACLAYLLTALPPGRLDVNTPKRSGWTVLHTAAQKGDVRTVALLLDYGARPTVVNKSGFTPLHVACQEGHLAIVQQLVCRDPTVILIANHIGRLPIHIAARGGFAPLVRWFLEGDGEPEDATNFKAAEGRALAWISPQPPGANLRALLTAEDHAGADVYHDALVGGNLGLLRYLLLQSAEDHPFNTLLRPRLHRAEGATGKSAAHLVVLTNQLPVLQFLHDHDLLGDPDVRDTWDEWTPLAYAARYGCVDCAAYLLRECRADPSPVDCHGRSPLAIGRYPILHLSVP